MNQFAQQQTTWYLFRHALATHSTNGYGEQILTAKILPEAIPPIKKMAAYLTHIPDSFNLSSELTRCVQTAQIITKITGKKFITDPRLNEYYQNTFAEFKDRVIDFLQSLNQNNSAQILICTHGAVIAAIKHLLLSGNFFQSQLNDYPECGQLLIIKNKKTKLLDFNT